MTEIEAKLRYKSKKVITDLLKKASFTLKGRKTIKDIYFNKSGNSMSNKNQLVRVRCVENEYVELSLKDKFKSNDGIWKRREINVPIIDAKKMITFLEVLGYQEIRANSSDREIWQNGKTSVEFISYTVPAKLEFIEIESNTTGNVDKIINYLGNNVSVAGEELFASFDERA
jgi:predicted adenylyl cyclase CyaB